MRIRGLERATVRSTGTKAPVGLLSGRNDPLDYADVILNGDPERYLKNVAGSHGLEI